MATVYTGYKPIVRSWQGSNAVNTFTGKVGVYSNWDLMSTSTALDGAPDYNVQPGTGAFPHDLVLSRWFLGLDRAGKQLEDAGILYPDVYSGRYNTWLYNGAAPSVWGRPTHGRTTGQGITGFGHLFTWGGEAAAETGNADTAGTGYSSRYASLGYFYYGLVNIASGGMKLESDLGHLERYPSYHAASNADGTGLQQAYSFGAFEPYVYKGVITERSDPLSSAVKNLGHTYYNASGVGVLATDRYGDEHTSEWFGVPSAKAL